MSDLERQAARRDELPESPEYELEVLRSATELLLRDLRSTFSAGLQADVFLDDDEATVCRFSDGGELAMAIYIDVSDHVASTVVTLATDVQDSDVFYGYVEPWPRCPVHPGGGHSLLARRFGEQAWWACPAGGAKVAPVGRLAD